MEVQWNELVGWLSGTQVSLATVGGALLAVIVGRKLLVWLLASVVWGGLKWAGGGIKGFVSLIGNGYWYGSMIPQTRIALGWMAVFAGLLTAGTSGAVTAYHATGIWRADGTMIGNAMGAIPLPVYGGMVPFGMAVAFMGGLSIIKANNDVERKRIADKEWADKIIALTKASQPAATVAGAMHSGPWGIPNWHQNIPNTISGRQ